MPNPFPGMNPYLEEPSFWRDVHQSLITYIRDALQPQLAPRYIARIDERVEIDIPPHEILPDVSVIEPATPSTSGGAAVAETTRVAIDEPVTLVCAEEYHEPFLVIYDPRGGQIVTIIEVLSPSNKSSAGGGQFNYLRKQRELFHYNVNLVEVDLLRGGLPTAAAEVDPLITVPPHDYLVSISRPAHRSQYQVYPIKLDAPLSTIGIPLRPTDKDVGLKLQELLNRCYDNGGFDAVIDYRREPVPPLTPEQGAWADALLREKGLRS